MKSKGFMVCVLVIVLMPAVVLAAAAKKHPSVTLEQDCVECHEQAAKVWEEGTHGLMGVKCVVCHGDLTKRFTGKPDAVKCTGCHAGQVAGTAEGHMVKEKDCWACHEGHSLKTRPKK